MRRPLRKPQNETVFTVRLSPDLAEELRKRIEERESSANAELRDAVRRHLKEPA
jgi:hypothetical protein